MGIIVQKFGGTSVASVERIIQVIPKIQKELKRHQVVVVISAMAGVTNTLMEYCKKLYVQNHNIEKKTIDFVLSNGENINCGLMSLALNSFGIRSVPLQGWQIPIITNNQSSKALILKINTNIILRHINQGVTPIICGFQGINLDDVDNKYITTLGRGGSDITAVAIAASLNAERCDIYTDVPGIYTADPRLINNAHKITRIQHDNILEMSYLGAKVMHPRSIEIAKEFQIEINVLSSFEETHGTKIIANKNMELSQITGIVFNPNILMANIESDRPLYEILDKLIQDDVSINLTLQREKIGTLICPLEDLNALENKLVSCLGRKKIKTFNIQTDIAQVSVVGNKLLNEKSIIKGISELISSFNPIYLQPEHSKITIILSQKDAQILAQRLHQNFIENKNTFDLI